MEKMRAAVQVITVTQVSTVAFCREHREEQDTGVDKPLLGRNEAAGHSKACEAGLVGILAALSRATEALPLSQREGLCRCARQAASSVLLLCVVPPLAYDQCARPGCLLCASAVSCGPIDSPPTV